MTGPESTLAKCERHVREGEARVAHQAATLAELERDGHTGRTVELGREILRTMRDALALSREHLERERAITAGVTFIEENGGGPGVKLRKVEM